MSAARRGQKGAESDLMRVKARDSKKPTSGRLQKELKSSNEGASGGSRAGSRNKYGVNELQLLNSGAILRSDLDLRLEDLGHSDSYSDDGGAYDEEEDDLVGVTGRTAEIFGTGIPEPLTDRSKRDMAQGQQFDVDPSDEDDDEYHALRQIALMESEAREEEDLEVGSDEERDIMAEIRAEITDKVREEMKSELEVYKRARERLDTDDQPPDSARKGLEGMEPKLKEAFLKMRKLDKILEKKVKKEKQVKRERIMLQKRLRQELEDLKKDPEKSATTDEKKNTDKFIMLALPPSHNSGISLEYPENPEADTPVTPLFATQLPDDGPQQGDDGDSVGRQSAASRAGSGRQTRINGNKSGASSVSGVSSTMTTDSSGKPIKRKNKKKDFIKRNIQLASDASNTIAMTDDEKKRLEDLLCDLDSVQEITLTEDSHDSQLTPSYLGQVAVPQGDGFLPSVDERQQLQQIDSRLRMLMPPEDFESIASASPRAYSSTGSMLFTKTSLSSLSTIAEGDQSELGEHVLRETKDQRDKQEHLRRIEDELNKLTTAVESEMESPQLSECQLNRLLDDCARTMSRVTEETSSIAASALSSSRSSVTTSVAGSSRSSLASVSSRAPSSVHSSLYDNPPHLPQNVLQQLLSDARRSMGGSTEPQYANAGEGRGGVGSPVQRHDDLVLESFSEDSLRTSRASNLSDSRASSRASLSSRQAKVKDNNLFQKPGYLPHRQSADNAKRPFLPEIDPLGRLSTQRPPSQRLNNENTSRPPSRSLSAVYTVRNSFSDSHSNRPEESDDHSSSDQTSDDDRTM